MKEQQFELRRLPAMLGLACLLGTTGCRTFTTTAEDIERERKFAQESQRGYWAGAWSLFAPPACSPAYYGNWGCPDLYPVGIGPANARPWVANAAGGGLARNCSLGR